MTTQNNFQMRTGFLEGIWTDDGDVSVSGFHCKIRPLGLKYLLYLLPEPGDIIPPQEFWLTGLRTNSEGDPAPLLLWEEVSSCPVETWWPKPTPVLWEVFLSWYLGWGCPPAPWLPCFLAGVVGCSSCRPCHPKEPQRPLVPRGQPANATCNDSALKTTIPHQIP